MGIGFPRKSAHFVLGIGLVLLPVAFIHGMADRQEPGAWRHDFLSPPARVADPAYRIVAFGSSSTRGFGASADALTYPSRLQGLFKADADGPAVDVVNRGVNGEDLTDMMRRLQSDILSRHPELVIWQIGSNDALHGISLNQFEAELRRGVTAIRASGADLVLMGPQWVPKRSSDQAFAAYEKAVRQVGQDNAVTVIDRVTLMQGWMRDGIIKAEELIGPDGLHMTDRGYQLLADAVHRTILAEPFYRKRRTAQGATPDLGPAGSL